MTSILILGAGGHAKVVADILIGQGIEVMGYLDDNPQTWNTKPLNIPVLGPTHIYAQYEADGMIIGIGSNIIRRSLVDQLGADGRVSWANAIHHQSIIAPSVRLGVGLIIAAGAILTPDSVIGDHVIINTAATVDHDCQIGAFCHIAPGSHLGGGVQVGEGTLIGIGATVLPYCKIGCNVTVGGGAVVVNDIPDGMTVKGIPAR
ncbi:MAG: acetyltransferase [Chloroflexi bacterium]|nr:acetyltransferase [Chloroflexota bacterium]